MRDQAHVAGWRWDTVSLCFVAPLDLVAWTGSAPATLLATLVNEGKKEGGLANLHRWEIQDRDLEEGVPPAIHLPLTKEPTCHIAIVPLLCNPSGHSAQLVFH